MFYPLNVFLNYFCFIDVHMISVVFARIAVVLLLFLLLSPSMFFIEFVVQRFRAIRASSPHGSLAAMGLNIAIRIFSAHCPLCATL